MFKQWAVNQAGQFSGFPSQAFVTDFSICYLNETKTRSKKTPVRIEKKEKKNHPAKVSMFHGLQGQKLPGSLRWCLFHPNCSSSLSNRTDKKGLKTVIILSQSVISRSWRQLLLIWDIHTVYFDVTKSWLMKHNINLPDLEKDTHNRAPFIHTEWKYAFENEKPSFTKGASIINHI